VTVKRRNKSDGEQTYPMMGRVPLIDLASWQEEGVDRHVVIWVTVDWGGRKINNRVKVYSGSRLIELNLVPWTCLTNRTDISDGSRLNNLT
jgi:hypothetical protein